MCNWTAQNWIRYQPTPLKPPWRTAPGPVHLGRSPSTAVRTPWRRWARRKCSTNTTNKARRACLMLLTPCRTSCRPTLTDRSRPTRAGPRRPADGTGTVLGCSGRGRVGHGCYRGHGRGCCLGHGRGRSCGWLMPWSWSWLLPWL